MPYQDIRVYSFSNPPSATDALYEKRYSGDSSLRLGLDINGFDAFVLINPDLLSVISSIYQLDKKLSLLSERIPAEALHQFVTISMIEEIQQSNEVENVDSTRKEIRDALMAVRSGSYGKRFSSMVGKYMLLQSGKEISLSNSQEIRTLYNEFILDEVVREDPGDRPDGEIFRREPVHVANRQGESIHDGLYPEQKIIAAMETALSILNSNEYDILIRVALFHYFFGYIHPFYNGNGRMTRFISSYMLSRYFSGSACLRISDMIMRNRSRYYELFRNANDKRNRGELTSFVIGFLQFFRAAIEDAYGTLSEKNSLYQDLQKKLDRWLSEHLNRLSSAQRFGFSCMLQTDLFGDSPLDIAAITGFMDCSEKTARKILSEAGDLVDGSKDGKKQLWHINIHLLSQAP